MAERITLTLVEEGRMGEHNSDEQRVLHEQRSKEADQIAQQLGETEAEPRKTIYKVVKKLGGDEAQRFVQKALEIESTGGMMVPDLSRRRTIGGIFFYLVKTELPAEVTRHIFPMRLPLHLKKKSHSHKPFEAKGMTPPVAPEAKREQLPFTWESRIDALAEIAIEERGGTTVKVTLIGRPGKIVERGQSVVTTMQQSPKLPPLPKGLPIPKPDQIEHSLYAVYISAKQWNGVAEAMKDLEDVLIIEGWQLLDKQTETITVFAMNTTTKKLQAAKRQSSPPQK
jgi:PHAX RNA-binding domain